MDAPKGQKLFNTRKACEARISTVIKSWRRQFKFKCFACQSYFEGAQQLSTHDTGWCQMLHSNQETPSKVCITQCAEMILNKIEKTFNKTYTG